jgi:hypothetical protein
VRNLLFQSCGSIFLYARIPTENQFVFIRKGKRQVVSPCSAFALLGVDIERMKIRPARIVLPGRSGMDSFSRIVGPEVLSASWWSLSFVITSANEVKENASDNLQEKGVSSSQEQRQWRECRSDRRRY